VLQAVRPVLFVIPFEQHGSLFLDYNVYVQLSILRMCCPVAPVESRKPTPPL
jgi:hypothetical protein